MTTLEEVRGPAEIYDAHFVPALFAQWGPVVAAEAGVRKGDRVLDVACGTGALTLAAAEIAGPSGSVVGLDVNPEMLAVARRKPLQIEWLEGSAEALPLLSNSFDAVVSQFGFMFFEDKPKALGEMMRVLKPDGRLALEFVSRQAPDLWGRNGVARVELSGPDGGSIAVEESTAAAALTARFEEVLAQREEDRRELEAAGLDPDEDDV